MLYCFVETRRFREKLQGHAHLRGVYQALREKHEGKDAIGYTVPGFTPLGGGLFCRRYGGHSLVIRVKGHTVPVDGYGPIQVVALYAVDVVPWDSTRDLVADTYEQDIEQAGRSSNLAAIVKKFVDEPEQAPPPPLPPAPPALVRWWSGLTVPRPEWFAFESRRWSDAVRAFPLNLDAVLAETLGQIASLAGSDSSLLSETPGVLQVRDTVWHVVYACALGHVYLLDLVRAESTRDSRLLRAMEEAREQWGGLCQALRAVEKNEQEVVDRLARASVRAYPCLILGDQELSLTAIKRPRTQSEVAFDIALSSEEVEILDRLCRGKALPLFLQGRAGSGKSTVLFYYLVELACHLDPELAQYGTITLVTHSERLVKAARNVVKQLLAIARRLNRGGAVSDKDIIICTFQDLCLRNLPEEARRRFADDFGPYGGYINAARFRALYKGNVAATMKPYVPKTVAVRHIPWETAWHVIRSYIKGYRLPRDSHDFLEPEDYAQLPSGDRSVAQDEYETIWREIWPWYRDLTCSSGAEGETPLFWDDLDLAREMLLTAASKGLNRNEESRPALVLLCDEAQDFSAVELIALLREYAWIRYDLTGLTHGQQKLPLPLVLAGDPFQTVNPSGFRWTLASRIVDKALQQCFGGVRIASVTEQDLGFNYRNPDQVARLANSIQWVRKKLFKHTSKPQQIWKEGTAASVGWLDLGERDVQKTLTTANLPIVVPVALDSLSTEDRRQFLPEFSDEELDRLNSVALTPDQVKGLEFPKAIVLGFGRWFRVQNWLRLLADGTMDEDDPRRYPLEYFFNCLYVSVTRPTEQLFVVDAREDVEEGLWKMLRQDLVADAIVRPPFAQWVGFRMVPSQIGELMGDPLSLAWPLWEEAEEKEDATLARKAAHYFELGGDSKHARIALAHALYWEGKPRDAAERLKEDPDQGSTALAWFFEAGDWESVEALASELGPGRTMEAIRQLAHIMNHGADSVQTVETAMECVAGLANAPLLEKARGQGKRFKQIAHDLLDACVSCCASETDVSLLARVYWRFRDGFLDRYSLRPELMAKLAYRIAELESPEGRRRYLQEAVALWERAGVEHQGKEYYIAKAQLSSFPESLSWWYRAGLPQEVVREFDEYGSDRSLIRLADYRSVISESLQLVGRIGDAFVVEFIADSLRGSGAFGPALILVKHAGQLDRRHVSFLQQARERIQRDPAIENPEVFYLTRLGRLVEAIDATGLSDDTVEQSSRLRLDNAELRTELINAAMWDLLDPDAPIQPWGDWVRRLEERFHATRIPVLESQTGLATLGWVTRLAMFARRYLKQQGDALYQQSQAGDLLRAARAWLGALELLFEIPRADSGEPKARPRSYFERQDILAAVPVAPGTVTHKTDQRYTELVRDVVEVGLVFPAQLLEERRDRSDIAELTRYVEAVTRAMVSELRGLCTVLSEPTAVRPWWRLATALALLSPYRRLAVEVAETWYAVDRCIDAKRLLAEARRRHAELGFRFIVSRDKRSATAGEIQIDYLPARNEVVIEHKPSRRMAYFDTRYLAFRQESNLSTRSAGHRQWRVRVEDGELTVRFEHEHRALIIDTEAGKVKVVL